MLYWLTGLAGAGKTTIGRALYDKLKAQNPATVFLDGDGLRDITGGRYGYTLSERLECSLFYSRLCEELTRQGIDVVCSVCAMFDDVRAKNRKRIENYCEVYIRVNDKTLLARNQKSLYTSNNGNVYGVDITPELPENPDIIIDNDGSLTPGECADLILSFITGKRK